MKRYNLHGHPNESGYHEPLEDIIDDGKWVKYEDVEGWFNQIEYRLELGKGYISEAEYLIKEAKGETK